MSILSINTNLMALNVGSNLSRHYNSLSTSTRRLSSGLRVGMAADDAAGLAARELMRSDIASLKQGIRNANDAISLIQTADGALQVVDEMLVRMKELAEQASTGTYDSTQRLIIDEEYQLLAREMTRIGRATEFNRITLLNGNLEPAHDGSGMGPRSGPPGSLDGIMFGSQLKVHFGTGNDSAEDYYMVEIRDTTNMYLNLGDEFSIKDMATAEMTRPFLLTIEMRLKPRIMPDGLTPEQQAAAAAQGKITREEFDAVLDAVRNASEGFMDQAAYGFDTDAAFQTAFEETFGANVVPRGTPIHNGPEGLTYAWLEGMDAADWGAMRAAYAALEGDEKEKYHMAFLRQAVQNLGDSLRDGSIFDPGGFFAGVDQKFYKDIASAGIAAVGQFRHLHTYAGRNIRNQENAQAALEAIDRAVIKKDQNRAHLGALQNRLENTIANLTIQAENLQAAESRISDVDVATEMTEFVRSQILTQAAVGMLSQANSMPQTLMTLIRG